MKKRVMIVNGEDYAKAIALLQKAKIAVWNDTEKFAFNLISFIIGVASMIIAGIAISLLN
jgi:hypothetical protein